MSGFGSAIFTSRPEELLNDDPVEGLFSELQTYRAHRFRVLIAWQRYYSYCSSVTAEVLVPGCKRAGVTSLRDSHAVRFGSCRHKGGSCGLKTSVIFARVLTCLFANQAMAING